jgi:excisionase family DNA binding protein
MQTAKLLTVPAFAAELGVTPACIRRWILERKITIVRVGRLVRVPATEIERIVRFGTRPALREMRLR